MLALVFAFSPNALADNQPAIYVDGNYVYFDVAPVIINGTTLAPMRAIFEAIGANVEWDQATKTAVGQKDGNLVSVQIGNGFGYKNGQAIPLLEPARLINSRTMVPLRFISESLGCDVQWEGTTKTITITTSLVPPVDVTPLPPPEILPPPETVPVADIHAGQVNWTGHYYITATGTKYHYLDNCGNGTYYETDEQNALNHYTPCEKCVR